MPVFFLDETLNTIMHIDMDLISEILFQWVNTAVVIAILALLLYKPVKKFLADRTERIRKQFEDAAADSALAKDLKENYEQRLALIEIEKNELLEQARHRALEKESQIIIEAKREANAILERAKLEIEREISEARNDIKAQIVETSALMAERYVILNMDNKSQHKMVDDLINGLEEVKWNS